MNVPIRLLICVIWTLSVGSSGLMADDKKAQSPLSGKITDVEGNPVVKAKLVLLARDRRDSIETVTDQNGVYEFEQVTPGDYQIEIESKACVTPKDYRKQPKVTVVKGESLVRDFSFPRACQIDVRAVDENGKPVRGVKIHVGLMGNDWFENKNDREHTDAGGRVIVGGLAPSTGKYIVAAESRRYAFEHTLLQLNDPNEIVQHKFVMREGESVEGTVICSDGKPPTGWRILAMPDWWRFPRSPAGKPVGKDGEFKLNHIVDGKYNVTISVPNGNGSSPKTVAKAAELNKLKRPVELKMDHPSPSSMHYLEAKIRWLGRPSESGFEISARSKDKKYYSSIYVDAGVNEFKLGPTPAGEYDLSISNPKIEVFNSTQVKNLPGLKSISIPNEKRIQIALRRKDQPIIRAVIVDAKTKETISKFRYRHTGEKSWRQFASQSGEIEVEIPRPGGYRLAAIADGYAMTVSDLIDTRIQDDRVTIELRRGASLAGTVIDSEGNPVDGAIVIPTKLAASAPSTFARFISDLDAVKTVDGKFRFEHLPHGEQSFRVLHRDFVRTDVHSVEIKVDNEPLEITLDSGTSVRGQVFLENGKPASDVAINFSSQNSSSENYRIASAVTDQDGKYSVDNIPCRMCYVTRSDRYRAMGMVVQALLPRHDRENVLNLGGTTKLTGKLLVNGKPFANHRLHLGQPYFGPMGMITETDDQGAFTFHGPPSGKWRLHCKLTPNLNYRSVIREVSVLPGENMDVGDIQIQSGTVEFRFTTNGKTIVPQYQQLMYPRGSELEGVEAGRVGRQDDPSRQGIMQSVLVGDYELNASFDAVTLHYPVSVTEKKLNSVIEIEIPTGTASILPSIEVQNSQTEEPGEFSLRICSADGQRFYRFGKNESGNVEAKNLPAGKYQIRDSYRVGAKVLVEVVLEENASREVTVKPDASDYSRQGVAKVITLDSGGAVVSGKLIIGDAPLQVYANLDGYYLRGPAGEYTIQVNVPGFEPAEQRIRLYAQRELKKQRRVAPPLVGIELKRKTITDNR